MKMLSFRAARSFSSFTNGIGWGVSLPKINGPGGIAVTKYRIVKPYKDDTVWEDFLISLPEKDQLAKFTKDVPLFVRYLKIVTDKENRPQSFRDFFLRYKDGLTVESDVFLSTEELLSLMWKNGYSDQERNAIQFTFPSDYRFHYPELAALFDIKEEDAYNYCKRARMDKSHIGELDAEKMKPLAFLRDHWLLYAGGWYIFKNFAFFNYAFFLKTWGFTLWFVSAWMLFSKQAHKIWRRNEYMLQQKSAQSVMEGEDAIVTSMRRFANDAKALDYLKGFKPELQASLTEYRKGYAQHQEHLVTERILAQLEAVHRAESSMGSMLQETLVTEAVASFKDTFAKDEKLKQGALDAAIEALSGKKPASDPVLKFFGDAVKQAEVGSKAKPNKNGSIAERLAFALQQSESDFQRAFMVSQAEANEIKQIRSKVNGDFSKLDATASARLEQLYNSVNERTGFILPHENELKPVQESDASTSDYVKAVNAQVTELQAKVRKERLATFTSAFA